jgi:hypothetical protein
LTSDFLGGTGGFGGGRRKIERSSRSTSGGYSKTGTTLRRRCPQGFEFVNLVHDAIQPVIQDVLHAGRINFSGQYIA